jgi:hypothetical protein
VIHKCRLPGKNKNLFLIGDAFLKHFYSVYDFDRDTVSLGINMHSKGKVSMYKPGERPGTAVKADLQKKQGLGSVTIKKVDEFDDDDDDFLTQTKK